MATSPPSREGRKSETKDFAASLRAEQERLREFFAEQERRLAQAESLLEQEILDWEAAKTAADAEPRGDASSDDDYRRRYEMAIDDLRGLKTENAELQRQLAQAKATGPGQSQPAHLNWELEKQRILAALEAGGDDDGDGDADRRAERLKIEDVVRTTDRLLAEKDRELASLRERLETSRQEPEDNAERAKRNQAIDADAVIQEERARLQGLEKEWREKLRQAEVELSLERAKLARERTELENQAASTTGTPQSPGTVDAAGEPKRGRWLARLGLSEADRVRRRRR